MYKQENIQLGYLYSLLISLISLLGMTQCKCNEASETSGKLELEVSANKTLLRAPEREFEVIIKPSEGSYWPSLTDLKLKAQFLEQETLGENVQSSYLAHQHAADKQNLTTSFTIPLTDYKTEAEPDSEEEQNELRIPIVLQPANEATKLKVGLALINTQGNTLHTLEVVWIKNELLISDLTTLETQEGSVNLTLKNTKDIPLKTNNIILNLKSDQGETFLFSQTNTPQASLEELWNHHTTLDPGTKTSPISFKFNKTTGTQALSNLTITITQEDGKILASKTVPCPQIPTKTDQSAPLQVQQEENKQEKPEHPTTLPPKLQMRLVQITNKKFTLFIENTGQKVSKKLLQLVKFKYSIEGPGDISNIGFKRGSLADINGASLAELIGSGLQEGQTKPLEIILTADNADSLAINCSLEGPNSNLVTFNWEKEKQKGEEKRKTENVQLNTQQPDKKSQEKIEEVKEALPLSLPNLSIHTKASNTSPKIFKLVVTNQGESISEDVMKDVKLNYTLAGTGDITATYLKKRGNPKEDINGRPLLDFIKSGFSQDETKELELIIETGNAQTLNIKLTLAGTQNSNLATFDWTKKEKPTEKKEVVSKKEKTQQPIGNLQEKLMKNPEKGEELKENVPIKDEKQTQQAAGNQPEASSRQTLSKQQDQVKETTSNLQERPDQDPIKRKKEEFQAATSNSPAKEEQASIKEETQAQQATSSSLEKTEQASIKEQAQAQQTTSNLQEGSEQAQQQEEEEDHKDNTIDLPVSQNDLYISIKPDAKFPKIFKLLVTNKGESISKDAMKNVQLWYDIYEIGETANSGLKTRSGSKVINGDSLLSLIKSGLSKDQTAELEIIVETGNAETLTVEFFLDDIQRPKGKRRSNVATFVWPT